MRNYLKTYTDYKNRPTELTEAELSWFFGVVEKAKRATGCTVDIIPWDHEQYFDGHENALGVILTEDPKAPLSEGVDTYITIDNYYIDEMWKVAFAGGWSLEEETLEHVIAHEIAHLTVWRHGKRHTALTEQLYRQIMAA